MNCDQNVLTFLENLYRFQSVQHLSETLCEFLPDLIAGENVIICKHDGKHRIITSVIARHPFSRANMMPHINQSGMMAQHPFWESIFDTRQPVRSLSDLVSASTWRKNPLYNEVFAPDGIEDQINFEIMGNTSTFTTVNVLRGTRGFSESEHTLFCQLRPHIQQAFTNAVLAERSGVFQASPQSAWLIPVDMRGQLIHSRDEPLQKLEVRFGTPGKLPDLVADWLRTQVRHFNQGLLDSKIKPLLYQQGTRRWSFTLNRDPFQDHYLLSICEQRDESRRRALTPRERDVMQWVANGKTNQEIAAILDMGEQTVKTHLKRIFQKLGVDNRTSATLQWMNQPS